MAKHRSRISSESSDTAGERSAGRPPVDRGMTVPSPSTGRAREKRADPANGSVPIRSTDPQAAVQTAPTPVATVLESGNLDFFYRPCPGIAHPRSSDQLERAYLAMFPDDQIHHRNRLLAMAHGYFPPVIPEQDLPEERAWAFVQAVSHDPAALIEDLFSRAVSQDDQPAQECPRAAGDGRYLLLRQEDRTFLAYALRQPVPLGVAQQTLMLDPEASFELRIVQPTMPAPLPIEGSPAYPAALSEKLDGHLSIPADPTDFLDDRWTRVFLVSATTGLQARFGVAPNPSTRNDPSTRAAQALRAAAKRLRASCGVDVLTPLERGELV